MGSRSGKLFTVDRDLHEDSLFTTEDEDLAGWIAWIPGRPAPPPAQVAESSPTAAADEATAEEPVDVDQQPMTDAGERVHESEVERSSLRAGVWLLLLLGLLSAASVVAYLVLIRGRNPA
jgi:hypothetical protein